MSPMRLDKILVQRNLAESREKAQAMIMAGEVYVNGQRSDKAGKSYPDSARIEIRSNRPQFASRGGFKLAGALDALDLNPKGLRCLDVGQSTGGFTDCLLQRGAGGVTGVDVGYGQLALALRNDPRVTVIERTNFRYFDPDTLGAPVDLVVIDVSFISLTRILPVAISCLKENGKILALIKPQFEVGKGQVGSGGVVRDESLQARSVQNICTFARLELNLAVLSTVESSLPGPKGNREFFCLLGKNPDTAAQSEL